MTFEEELKESGLSNLDKVVEVVYRNCDCTVCNVTGVVCPYKDFTEEDITEETLNGCKKVIKEIILKAVKEN